MAYAAVDIILSAVLFAFLVYSVTVLGQEYPSFHEVPKGLTFSCSQKGPGYYADPETQCQVWHWCLPSGQQFSFLCPNGTVFNQLYRVCDWFFNVDCPAAPNFYNVNDDLYKDSNGNPI